MGSAPAHRLWNLRVREGSKERLVGVLGQGEVAFKVTV